MLKATSVDQLSVRGDPRPVYRAVTSAAGRSDSADHTVNQPVSAQPNASVRGRAHWVALRSTDLLFHGDGVLVAEGDGIEKPHRMRAPALLIAKMRMVQGRLGSDRLGPAMLRAGHDIRKAQRRRPTAGGPGGVLRLFGRHERADDAPDRLAKKIEVTRRRFRSRHSASGRR